VARSSVKAGRKPVVVIAVAAPSGTVPTGRVVVSYKIGNKKGKAAARLVGGKARVRLPVALTKKNAAYKIVANYQGNLSVKPAKAKARLRPKVSAEMSRTSVDVAVRTFGVVKATGKVKVRLVNVITGRTMWTKALRLKPTKKPTRATAQAVIKPRLPRGTYRATITYLGNTQVAPVESKRAWKRVFRVYNQ
jgi:hypothetical protein